MGEQLMCSSCKNDTFNLFENVYSKEIISVPHVEIVCAKCRKGLPFRIKYIKINKEL